MSGLSRDGLSLVIVSREDCHRCETIRETANDYRIPVEVSYIDKGGAKILALAKFTPVILPAVVGYVNGVPTYRWTGVSEFLQAMETIE